MEDECKLVNECKSLEGYSIRGIPTILQVFPSWILPGSLMEEQGESRKTSSTEDADKDSSQCLSKSQSIVGRIEPEGIWKIPSELEEVNSTQSHSVC